MHPSLRHSRTGRRARTRNPARGFHCPNSRAVGNGKCEETEQMPRFQTALPQGCVFLSELGRVSGIGRAEAMWVVLSE